ncbi:MAG: cell division protein FtsB [Hyphomicrobiaceae bacterium]|jgi:cell division protein FtsB
MILVLRNKSHGRRSKSHRFSAFVLLSCLTLTIYFAHHAMYGRFGIENNRSLSARAQVLTDRLAALKAERDTYARDIGLLSGRPHPDMIEEAARRVLGYAYPNTKLIQIRR